MGNKVINLEEYRQRINASAQEDTDEAAPGTVIEVIRTPEYFEAQQELSEYIARLNLTEAQRNGLVHLIVKHSTIAERSALAQGIEIGERLYPAPE